MNMILGKKQLILASLVVALGMAVYLNYRFTDAGMDLLDQQSVLSGGDALVTESVETSVGEEGSEENYGEAQFVDTQDVSAQPLSQEGEEYFAQARLTRTKSRDEAQEALKVMLSDVQLDEAQKEELALQASQMAQSIETESKIENLILAKGFAECMVYCDQDKVDVIVKAGDLLDSEVVQIRDIVLEETSVPVENISIVPVK